MLLRARVLQAKLTVSHPQDVYEQEADRVADHVMRMADPAAPIAVQPATVVQRACKDCDEELRRSPDDDIELQRSEDSSANVPTVDSATERSIGSLSGRGRALPDAVRSFMEPRFAADFSAVRVHTDAHAHELARSVSARAFTVGHNVVFGAGYYDPHTENGQRLIAHELTHVVQQTTHTTAPATGMVQREVDPQTADPWSRLSPAGQQRARALYIQCTDLIGRLGDAQAAHVSSLRNVWLKFLSENVLVRIGNLDSDGKIAGIANVLQDYSDGILRNVANFFAEWETLERRYLDEHAWLLRRKFPDATLAAERIESLYDETTHWLAGGAKAYITDEDYGSLKLTLERGTHVSVGALQASRLRARQLDEVLDVVTELRRAGDDAEKYVPGWSTEVQNEVDNLEHLAARTKPTSGFDYPAEFARLRSDLLQKRETAL
ncbi:MAG: DUF4157 domain-containing protein, partial [Gemmatimonas sp.]